MLLLKVPLEPDVSIRLGVEQSTLSPSPNCCCQVELHLFPDSKSACMLYALDSNGNRKTTGGDEFYIRYEEYNDSTKEILTQAVALIADRSDGSYELNFFTTPMNPLLSSGTTSEEKETSTETILRTVTVYFEYTDRIGFLAPPSKKDWTSGGYSHKRYEVRLRLSGALQQQQQQQQQLPPPPIRIRQFVPPRPTVDLGDFDRVFAFGDSTFCQLLRQRPNKKGKYYFQPNLRILGEKVRMGLNSETVDALVELVGDDEVEKELLSNNECSSKSNNNNNNNRNGNDDNNHITTTTTTIKKALIVGSCLWDILSADDTLQGQGFENHRRACFDYVRLLKEKYPGVTIVWKSPMAVQIHWVDLQRVVEHDRSTATLFGRNRIKYMSGSRSRFLYELQKDVMEELGVPMMDLYEATYLSADWLYPSDGRHYKPDLNRTMLGWFYPATNNPGTHTHTHTQTDANRDGQKRVYYQHVVP
eukprot:jgi/Psemu1/254536/estExt_Genewise1Plus.C_1030028